MRRPASPLRVTIGILAIGLSGATAGCGGSPSPIRPSHVQASSTGASLPGAAEIAQAGGVLTPEDLTSRGWTCFQPPIPNRIVCSHPNQGLPVVGDPPPADRPASYSLFRFDGSGRFVGPVLLIRTDLYNGQLCESTGEPYVYVPIIGYYECLHPGGR
jgi:hypothetical protein